MTILRALGIAVAGVLCLAGSARAEIHCRATTNFFEWQCRYAAIDLKWTWQYIQVGQSNVDCNAHPTMVGTVTTCTTDSASVCGGSPHCDPGQVCPNPCQPPPPHECPKPTGACTGYVPPPERQGWVWADGQPGIYTPAAAYSYNSSGASNEVANVALGRYTVRFPNLAGIDGNVQVVATGTDDSRCKVATWDGAPGTKGPGDVTVDVRCHTPRGAPVDAPFAVNFLATHATGMTNSQIGLVAYGPSWLVVPDELQWSSRGSLPETERLDTGYYSIRFEGQVSTNPSVIVTALGQDASFCQHLYNSVDATGTSIYVFCFDTSGNLTDSAFTARYEWKRPPGSAPGGYLHADHSTLASYAPGTQYNATGAIDTASRSGTGSYAASYPKLAGKDSILADASSTVMVTASALGPVYCKPTRWYPYKGDIVVETQCRTSRGGFIDAGYQQVYKSSKVYGDVIGP